eukprot:1674162-Rhodomonas_salina.3
MQRCVEYVHNPSLTVTVGRATGGLPLDRRPVVLKLPTVVQFTVVARQHARHATRIDRCMVWKSRKKMPARGAQGYLFASCACLPPLRPSQKRNRCKVHPICTASCEKDVQYQIAKSNSIAHKRATISTITGVF